MRHLRMCLSVCGPAHVHVCHIHSLSHIRLCVCVSLVDDSLYCKAAAPFLCAVCTWQSVEQRWRPCIERTRVASAARDRDVPRV